jgi:hypothetical protein
MLTDASRISSARVSVNNTPLEPKRVGYDTES